MPEHYQRRDLSVRKALYAALCAASGINAAWWDLQACVMLLVPACMHDVEVTVSQPLSAWLDCSIVLGKAPIQRGSQCKEENGN